MTLKHRNLKSIFCSNHFNYLVGAISGMFTSKTADAKNDKDKAKGIATTSPDDDGLLLLIPATHSRMASTISAVWRGRVCLNWREGLYSLLNFAVSVSAPVASTSAPGPFIFHALAHAATPRVRALRLLE
jgi:hypothetical protein